MWNYTELNWSNPTNLKQDKFIKYYLVFYVLKDTKTIKVQLRYKNALLLVYEINKQFKLVRFRELKIIEYIIKI